MADIVPSVPITLDRERHLRFDRAAVKGSEASLEKLWGPDATFYSVLQDLAQVLSAGDIRRLRFSTVAILLWQGLLHDDARLTLEQVEEALPYSDPSALLPYVGKIIEAWFVASPQVPANDMAAQEAANQTDPLDASTGVPSGPTSAYASA